MAELIYWVAAALILTLLVVNAVNIRRLRRTVEQAARRDAEELAQVQQLITRGRDGLPRKRPRHLRPLIFAGLGATAVGWVKAHKAQTATAAVGTAAVTALVVAGSSSSDGTVPDPPSETPILGPPLPRETVRAPAHTTALPDLTAPPAGAATGTAPVGPATSDAATTEHLLPPLPLLSDLPRLTVTATVTTSVTLPPVTPTTSPPPIPTTTCVLEVEATPVADLCVLSR